MKPLKLNVAAPRREAQSSGIPTNPTRLEQWLKDLPPLDPSHTLKLILEGLQALRAIEMPEKLRLRLLVVVREHINGIFEAYDTQAFWRSLRADRSRSQVAGTVHLLISGLADAFKALVLREHEKGEAPSHDSVYLPVIYCAMEQLVHLMVHTFRVYGPIPARVHAEINQLFKVAEEHKVLYIPVTVGGKPAPYETVGHLYKQFSLMTISDPFHLAQGEALRVFQLLERYAAAAQILKSGRCELPAGHFVIDLDQDSPPLPCSRAPAAGSDDRRILDLIPVIRAAVRDEINENVSARHKLQADQARRLLAQIIPRFKGMRLRHEPRTSTTRSVAVALAIESVHYSLDNPQRLAERLHEDTAGIQVSTLGSESEAKHGLETWMVSDESPEGYKLVKEGRVPDDLRVGDVVAIVVGEGDPEGPRPELGFLRWMRRESAQRLTIGVNRVAEHPTAATCRPAGKVEGERLCLIMQAPQSKDIPRTLLAAKGIFHRGERLWITAAGQTFETTMTGRSAETAYLDRFTCSPMP